MLRLYFSIVVFSAFFLTSEIYANVVLSCSKDGRTCLARMPSGRIADHVVVKDANAHPIGYGRVVKRKGSFAVLHLTKLFKQVRKGFAVQIKYESKQDRIEWVNSHDNIHENID